MTGRIATIADARAWQRAAVLGSLWGAVEIVAGSVLHALRIPFSGSVLAALGVVVMTAGYLASPTRGVIWRSALVCALLKSFSPSAVLLGPMVGILTEGLFFQASVSLFGANALGFMAGGVLAVSWPLAQKITWALLAFGPDAMRLYAEAYRYASQSLGISRFGPFDLVGTLFLLQGVMGASAAVAGIRLERSFPPAAHAATADETPFPAPARMPIQAHGAWSIPRLLLFAAGAIGGMVCLSFFPLLPATVFIAAYAGLVFWRYPRALVQLRRPAFWVEGAGVILLATLFFGGVRNELGGALEGLGAGAKMVLRATLALLGATVASFELRNPRILEWFEQRGLQGLANALSVAFNVLPTFTAVVSDLKSFCRHPLVAIGTMLREAHTRSHPRTQRHHGVVILTGETGSGKTTRVGEVVQLLRQRGLRVGGIQAVGLVADDRRSGFDLVDLATGLTAPLCRERLDTTTGNERWGQFHFSEAGLAFGRQALTVSAHSADVVVIDEVGPLELAGGGWARSLDALVSSYPGRILLVARCSVVDAVKARWAMADTPVCHATRDEARRVADVVVQRLAVPDPLLRARA
jgi:nucleoside-triphosphatase THEP1